MKIKDVVERLSNDPGTWRRVRDEVASSPDPKLRFLTLAQEQGMTVDPTELDQAISSFGADLTDGELDAVSGGFNPQPDPPGGQYARSSTPYTQLVGLLQPVVNRSRL